jgi:hypothetical protein
MANKMTDAKEMLTMLRTLLEPEKHNTWTMRQIINTIYYVGQRDGRNDEYSPDIDAMINAAIKNVRNEN